MIVRKWRLWRLAVWDRRLWRATIELEIFSRHSYGDYSGSRRTRLANEVKRCRFHVELLYRLLEDARKLPEAKVVW